MNFRSFVIPLFLRLLLGAATARAQVVIYNFNFEKEGPSINYGFYEEAWVVTEAAGGPTSWVLMFREGAHRRYITVEEFGSLFFPNKGATIVGVLSAAAASGTPQTTFLALGEVEKTVRAGNISVQVPSSMSGYALSADDESDVPFNSQEGNVGYAGISKMKGSLQLTRTNDANARNLSVADTIADIVAYIERRGYNEFEVTPPDDGTGTDGGGGTGTSGAGAGGGGTGGGGTP